MADVTGVPAPARGHRVGQALALAGATACTLPAVVLRLSGEHPLDLSGALIFGLGVVGAAFLLAW